MRECKGDGVISGWTCGLALLVASTIGLGPLPAAWAKPPQGGGPKCGDGIIDGGEECDQSNLNGGTCVGVGFAGGDLACAGGCVYDTSACYDERFTDNEDGTITDNETGLQWEKKVKLDSTKDASNLQDANNSYAWSGVCSSDGVYCQPDAASEAACLAGVEGDSNGCSQCASGGCTVTLGGDTAWEWLAALNAASFAGYSDWRLPTKAELERLIDAEVYNPAVDDAFYGASCGTSCSDVTDPACSCTAASRYWSASSYLPLNTRAWDVSFYEGFDSPTTKPGNFLYVRAVRGGS